MDFELATILTPLVEANRLDEAIAICEQRLSELDETDFHSIIGNNLLDMTAKTVKWLDSFYEESSAQIVVKALYCELISFEINTQIWDANVFGYSVFDGLEDSDWLSDYGTISDTELVITEYSALQDAFENFESYGAIDENHQKARDLCEQLVILRFQELIHKAHSKAKADGLPWGNIPVLSTVHDYTTIHCSL